MHRCQLYHPIVELCARCAMPTRHAWRYAYAAPTLSLILGALLVGAALGYLLLPPGSLGWGADLWIPEAQVQAVAAAARSSLSSQSEEQQTDGHEQMRDSQSAVWAQTGSPAGGSHSRRAGPSVERRHDWRLEVQVGLSWQYAGGARSRALNAPVSPPIGEPR
jgi:hypothetical protein